MAAADVPDMAQAGGELTRQVSMQRSRKQKKHSQDRLNRSLREDVSHGRPQTRSLCERFALKQLLSCPADRRSACPKMRTQPSVNKFAENCPCILLLCEIGKIVYQKGIDEKKEYAIIMLQCSKIPRQLYYAQSTQLEGG